MDSIFIEQELGDTYRISFIDRQRIFEAENPGRLGTMFECSLSDPSPSDRAQIFFSMAPMIAADNIFVDLKDQNRSSKLNTWSIHVKDSDINNLFMALSTLNRADRLELYSERHGITPEETVTSTSKSLFSLVAFSDKLKWKTGILQRCIDCLVKPEFRRNNNVYSVIDEVYRQLMRFKYETEYKGTPKITDGIYVEFIRKIISFLGLKHSHDTSVFTEIPNDVDAHIDFFRNHQLFFKLDGSPRNNISTILTMWSGSRIIECEGGFCLEVDPIILEGLNYMEPLMTFPGALVIIETPM